MKVVTALIIPTIMMLVCGLSYAASSPPPADPGWPRVISQNGNELNIYQPQVDFWENYEKLGFRCAIAVKTAGSEQEKYGVAEINADTETDHESRTVILKPRKREIRFPNIEKSEADKLRGIVDELLPPVHDMTISLDRILAYLDPAKHPQQKPVSLNMDPPEIFYSSNPAILLIFLGEPQLRPVVKDKNDLMFVVNTNWDIFYETTEQQYYLLNGESWLTTKDVLKGKWTPAAVLPAGLSSLPADDNWADVRKNIPGKPATEVPEVFATTKAAELILTKGEPSYTPIPGTKLMRVANSDSSLFLDYSANRFYLLAAGRWFRAAGLEGPWAASSSDLPAEFARIPDDDPSAYVKASVPGTIEAKDAILLASVPVKTKVDLIDPVDLQVTYEGTPQFEQIESTPVKYAVNSPNVVFLVDGGYYCCYQGVWYTSSSAAGPWLFARSVPAAIYTIPPSNPLYNVTYVVVADTSPTTVVYTYTSGYSGEYVAATGVLMFGAGMAMGAMIADHNHYYYSWYHPAYYSYGCSARYSYAHGGYYSAAHRYYGPYGGAGAYAAYNPRTGTYSRGAYAYGPAGSASARQAYNPYTGTRASSRQVDTVYGSAGRGVAYNPNTGTAARGGYRTDAYGSAGGIQTNRGSSAFGWDTSQGQGAFAKDRQGNVYAGKDGNVYKKGSDGSWSANTGSGWNSVDRPRSSPDLEAQFQSRSRGNQLSSRGNRGGGGGRGGFRR